MPQAMELSHNIDDACECKHTGNRGIFGETCRVAYFFRLLSCFPASVLLWCIVLCVYFCWQLSAAAVMSPWLT